MHKRDGGPGGHPDRAAVGANAVNDLAALADRAACADLVIAYTDRLDARDWVGFRELFTDQIEIDYAEIGSITGRIAADDWAERCALLGHFDATRHRLSNIRHIPGNGRATVTSAVDAAHFITAGGTTLYGDLIGDYRHELIRIDRGWRIAGCRLTVAGYPAGKDAFDLVFASARAKQNKEAAP